jgi:hypothetical protein
MFFRMADGNQKDIEALAFLIWQQQGCPENRSEEHWLEAEYQILSRSLVNGQSVAQTDNDLHSRGLGSL